MVFGLDRQNFSRLSKFLWLFGLVVTFLALPDRSVHASDGTVHPDTARIQCTFEMTGDTVVVQLKSLSGGTVQHLVFSHQSVSQASSLLFTVDGQVISSVQTEVEFSTINQSWYTVRWLIGNFTQTAVFKYCAAATSASYFNWSAGHPYPVFGTGEVTCTGCCCLGARGNVNAAGIIDLSDLSSLVSYLTGGGYVLSCPEAANVNRVGIVDLSDLSALVSYLTGGGYVLPNCP